MGLSVPEFLLSPDYYPREFESKFPLVIDLGAEAWYFYRALIKSTKIMHINPHPVIKPSQLQGNHAELDIQKLI